MASGKVIHNLAAVVDNAGPPRRRMRNGRAAGPQASSMTVILRALHNSRTGSLRSP